MKLSGLLDIIHEAPSYGKVVRDLKAGGGTYDLVVPDAARPFLLACLYRDLGVPVLFLTDKPERAKTLYEEISAWSGGDVSLLHFPEPDALPYEELMADPYTLHQRIKVLAHLAGNGKSPLIVASAHAIWRKTVSRADFAPAIHVLKKGMKVNLNELLEKWLSLGYVVERTVELPGTVSRRGGIIDIYPPHNELPARIELFGDVIDSIRLFDPASQRSQQLADQITVTPAREMLVHSGRMSDFDLSTLTENARARMEKELADLAGGRWFDGVEFYDALFNNGLFFDHLPATTVIVIDQPDAVETEVRDLETQAKELRRVQVERGELPAGFPVPYFAWDELRAGLDRFPRLLLSGWDAEIEGEGKREKGEGHDQDRPRSTLYPVPSTLFGPAPAFAGNIPLVLKQVRDSARDKRRLVVVSQQASRLRELLADEDIIAVPVSAVEQVPADGSLTLVQGSLAGGWTLGDTTVLSDVEIFGFAKRARRAVRRPVRREAFLAEVGVGDYVVHVDHGIARFAGLTRLSRGDSEREYLVLEYAAGDKLYVPSDQSDRVSRYVGPGGHIPSLTRLGTQEWTRAKQRVKEATANLARELLQLYSQRQAVAGHAFSPDTVWQQEMEASFPFVETPDQLDTVQEVKDDMEKPRPMDRLVCGDVGYGKTEVALRAAFKAVMDGMQVAVLVPTTVLAQQHFETFTQRLGAFPVKVELLSRFRTDKEQDDVTERLASGGVDIVIGTHRLLQKDVSFKNLGLVVVDEEQRFGVAHKERLKKLRSEVDVLTLTATPIPRTLHMSTVGIRDMSLMETPPEERLPVKSYVAAYDENVIREAILRELDRGGQVFFVHNRVQSIGWMARKLAELVPEARIGIGHGQMPEDSLESVMFDLAQGNIDVLVCTTIIESGLDLPNVNTLIVNNADRFGLTQLYQLRGRVGRGATRAYAYFFYEKGRQLTDVARRRLETIFEASELGAGFRIAMKDLEIRGAGNLLGAEQSGHMGSVGFELYCRLLADAVEEIKSKGKTAEPTPPPSASATIDLPLDAFIPEDYVTDLDSRLSLYLRLSKVDSVERAQELRKESVDRYGPAPGPLKNLIYIISLKLMAAKAGIKDISREDGSLVLKLSPEAKVDRLSLQRLFGSRLKIGTNQLRLDVSKDRLWQHSLEQAVKKVSR